MRDYAAEFADSWTTFLEMLLELKCMRMSSRDLDLRKGLRVSGKVLKLL
jgi:hypothetical protein